MLLGVFDELVREMNLREAIHGTFDLSTGDLLHVVKSAGEEFSAFLEAIEDLTTFFLVQLDTFGRLASNVRRVGHEVDSDLANSIRAQLDRLEFVKDFLSATR